MRGIQCVGEKVYVDFVTCVGHYRNIALTKLREDRLLNVRWRTLEIFP